MSRSRKRRREQARQQRRAASPSTSSPSPSPPTESTLERLAKRRDHLRSVLADLLEGAEPGSIAALRRRPAIEAEIWSCEAQVHLELAHADPTSKFTAVHLTAAQECNAEAQRCQSEARRAHLLAAVEELDELERRLGMNSELAAEMRRLR